MHQDNLVVGFVGLLTTGARAFDEVFSQVGLGYVKLESRLLRA